MAEQLNLLPCPFCGCAMTIKSNRDWHRIDGEHADDCALDSDFEITVPAQPEALAWMVATWNRRTAPVSAPMGQELPPLPACVAYGVVGLSGLDPKDGHRQLSGVSVVRPGSWCKNSTVELYTAEQFRQGQRDAIAPYADRIRHLERELAERKPVAWAYECRQCITDDLWAEFISRQRPQEADFVRNVRPLAYIDGRTAGTAPADPVEGDLLPPVGSRVLIHLGRQDAWVEHTVTGYYVWGALSHQVREGEKNAHRVFVRVKDDEGYDNARLLSEVRRIAAAATPINSGREEA